MARRFLRPVTLALVVLACYLNSPRVPFLFDDLSAVVGNPSIRDLGALPAVLSPPDSQTTAGRPLFNLSLALNYALGGANPRGYHLVSILLHVMLACSILSLVTRTTRLIRPPIADEDARLIGFTTALMWSVHPVLTETVTYVSQRCEIMAGLFYVLTLVCLVRSIESTRAWIWQIASVGCCALGHVSKEVTATAPVAAFLLDWLVITGSFREVWRRRWAYYLGLSATWILTALLLVDPAARGLAPELNGLGNLTKEIPAVGRYLHLAVFPYPLVFDYGPHVQFGPALTLLYWLLVLGALTGTIVVTLRNRALGYPLICFFLILAPTSSFLAIVHQPVAENRLYLPLVCLITFLVVVGFIWRGRRMLWLCLACCPILGISTLRRNADYGDPRVLWSDTVRKQPGNARAWVHWGMAEDAAGNRAGATSAYRAALDLAPSDPTANVNLGNILFQEGRTAEAQAHYEKALEERPDYASAHYNLGCLLNTQGKYRESCSHLEIAIASKMDSAEAHQQLAEALRHVGRPGEAIAHYATAHQLASGDTALTVAFANALFEAGRIEEALPLYATAVGQSPYSGGLRYNYANALLAKGQTTGAIEQFLLAIKYDPALTGAYYNLGLALAQIGQAKEAIPYYQETLKRMPGLAAAHLNLSLAFEHCGDLPNAIAQAEEAARLEPANPELRRHLTRLRGW